MVIGVGGNEPPGQVGGPGLYQKASRTSCVE